MSCAEWGTLMNSFEELGGHWSSTIIWNKSSFVMGRQDYQRKFEPILYGWTEGNKHYFCNDRTQSDVWDIHKPVKNDLHPTMKPVELCKRAVDNSSQFNDIILDLFAGSGSTLIACEQSSRTCYAMDLDEYYCDVIVTRYCNFTNSKIVKINGVETVWEK